MEFITKDAAKIHKVVALNLVGQNGNAFALLAAFHRAARKDDWTPSEIEGVTKECESGDYHHLLMTLTHFTKPEPEDE